MKIWCAYAMAMLCPVAMAAPNNFALGDGVAGPTCASFVSMGAMAWERAGGDWTDANGKLYGTHPFATQTVPMTQGRQVIDWDVTTLIQNSLDERQLNTTMLLRSQPGVKSGIVEFHSRESKDSAGWPMLKLQWADGSQTRQGAAADTFLDCTSIASLGGRASMQVSGAQNTLLRFVLPKPKVKLLQAVLYLVTDRQYQGSSEIGIYRTAPPYARGVMNIKHGLAENYVRDEGIENDPNVVFATGFESFFWIANWSYYDPRNTTETIASDDARLFEPLQGKALRVRLVKGKNLGLDLRYALSRWGAPEPDEIYFRYYLRFADDWNPSADGGKMPGIAGTYGRGGWGMRKSDGYNGWSVRGGFAARPAGDKSVMGMTAIGSYAYHADIGASGDYWGWNQGPTGLLENNRWYSVEQYVKLNTPGVKDGIFRAWIDGVQVLEKKAIQFRLTPKLKIENIWMDVYHGGTSVAPQDMTLYFDNVVIARKYIGPLRR